MARFGPHRNRKKKTGKMLQYNHLMPYLLCSYELLAICAVSRGHVSQSLKKAFASPLCVCSKALLIYVP